MVAAKAFRSGVPFYVNPELEMNELDFLFTNKFVEDLVDNHEGCVWKLQTAGMNQVLKVSEVVLYMRNKCSQSLSLYPG